MKLELTPAQRRALRGQAHHVDPVVMVGHDGLTPAVLHEIDVNLLAHGLIKIRVLGDDRDAREAMLDRISDALDAAPVQHIGKLLVVYRPLPDAGRKPNRQSAGDDRRASTKSPHRTAPKVPRGRARQVSQTSARDRRDARAPNGTRRTPGAHTSARGAPAPRTPRGVPAPGTPRGISGRRRRTG
jgi:putative YhbY family RNA-binding protein